MDQNKGLPWEVFRLTSALLPHLDRLFETSTLTPTSLLVLSHLKHLGNDYGPERKILLKNEVLDLLKRVYGYSAAAATTIVKNLHNGGLVDVESLTADKKEHYFGERRGYKDAIVLTARGVAELDNFNRNLNRPLWAPPLRKTLRCGICAPVVSTPAISAPVETTPVWQANPSV